MSLIKSKKRIADHGEVFTPEWMVEDMLDLVKDETYRIDSRFLEPACGSGNFLVKILKRKLLSVNQKYGTSDFENLQYSMLSLMSIYGIEILEDNVKECRDNMLAVFFEYVTDDNECITQNAASYILSQNIIHADALKMETISGKPVTFAEWGYVGKGKFQRRDFRYDTLQQMSTYTGEGSLFSEMDKRDIFTPLKVYPLMTLSDLSVLHKNSGTKG